MAPDEGSPPRALSAGMRRLLVIAGVLVVLAGLTLYVFPLRTAELFAWTINPPMTAVFLGASYWAAAAIEWMAASRRSWAEARIAVPGVFLFTVLTLIVTLVHLDRFHLAAELPIGTRLITWAWLAIYALVPVFMAIIWVRQSRQSGSDPPRSAGLPPLIRLTLAMQVAVLAVVGAGLLITPVTFAGLWPWQLTPLTGRAIGAWLVSLAVIAAQALWGNDVRRFRPAALGSLVFAVLQLLGLARHWSDLAGTGATAAYVVVLMSFLVTGSTAFAGRTAFGTQAAPAGPKG